MPIAAESLSYGTELNKLREATIGPCESNYPPHGLVQYRSTPSLGFVHKAPLIRGTLEQRETLSICSGEGLVSSEASHENVARSVKYAPDMTKTNKLLILSQI